MSALAPETLNGIQKTAILCLTLSPDRTKAILDQLGPEAVEAVCREMATLSVVEPGIVRHVLHEYHAGSPPADRAVRGGFETASRILQDALGEKKADNLVDKVRRQVQGGLAELESMEPRMFASILVDEHPQTIAVILSHLDLKQASKALDELPPELGSDVLYRMADMDKILPETLAILEEGLKSKTDLSLTQEMSSPGDPSRVAKLINMAGSGRDEQLLKAIGDRSEELANRIKALMFVFEDLLQIDKKGIQRVLREVDNKDLSIALKGASGELKTHIFGNMSERAAAALEEEIDLLGAVRVSDVEAAQQRIMEGVRELEEAGEVNVQREGETSDFIS